MASPQDSSSPEPDILPRLVLQSVGQGQEQGSVIPLKPVLVTDTAPEEGGESIGRAGAYSGGGQDDSSVVPEERSGSAMNITPALQRGHSHSGMSDSSGQSQEEQDPEESFILRKGQRKRRVLPQSSGSSSDSDFAVTDLTTEGFILRKGHKAKSPLREEGGESHDIQPPAHDTQHLSLDIQPSRHDTQPLSQDDQPKERRGSGMNITPSPQRSRSYSETSSSSDNREQDPDESFVLRKGQRKRRALLQSGDLSSDSDDAVTDLSTQGYILKKGRKAKSPSREEGRKSQDTHSLSPEGQARADSKQGARSVESSPAQDDLIKVPETLETRRRSSGMISITHTKSPSTISTSSSDESISKFTREGSYALRKKREKVVTSLPRQGNVNSLQRPGNANSLQRPSGISITPQQSLDRSHPGLSSSSSEESLAGVFQRGTQQGGSFYLRGNKRRSTAASDTVIANQGALELQPQPPVVIVTPTPSHDASEEVAEEATQEEDDKLYSDELDALLDGTVDHRIKNRAKRSLKAALEELDNLEKHKAESALSRACDASRCFPCLEEVKEPPVPPELRAMNWLGFKIAPTFFFPALPKVLQDIWVGAELLITFFEFVFACVTFSVGVANILVVVLSLINLTLASIDGFLHFVEGGSCVACFRWGRRKLKKRMAAKHGGNNVEEAGGSKDEKDSPCKFLPERARKLFQTGSEVVRASLTELLLYPLTVLDFLELIESETYRGGDAENEINFSLFNIGLFYLIMTVYFIRVFMSISTIVSISRLPKTTQTKYPALLKKFSLHLIGQIIVHMIILAMVSTKINSEHCVVVEGSAGNETSSTTNISPFLYVTIFTGDVIPFLGVAMFFVVNYPALKQFSMGFCIDLMSTIVSEDFGDTAFKGKGVKHANRKARKVDEKINLALARQQYGVYSNFFSFKKKLAYRLTNPLVVSLSVIYTALISVFLVCHALGWNDACDSGSGVSLVTFNDSNGAFVTFILGLIALTFANYQAISISLIWLLTLCGLALFVITLPVIAVVLLPFVLVIILFISCL